MNSNKQTNCVIKPKALMIVLGLLSFMATSCATSDIGWEGATNDERKYYTLMSKIAEVIESIETLDDVAIAEPKVKKLFDKMAELYLDSDDPDAMMDMSADPHLSEINLRIETALQNSSSEVQQALQEVMIESSEKIKAAIIEVHSRENE